MATVRRNFNINQGLTAEGGDITIKSGNSLVLNDTSENGIDISAPSLAAAYSLVLPDSDGDANDVLQTDGSGNLSWTSLGDLGGGTVTSVAMSVPTGLAISGTPITTSGTLALTLDTGYEIPTTATLNTFITASSTDTLTNKTLTAPVITSPDISGNTTFSDDSSAHDFDIASHDGANGLKLGGTLVTASAAELNFNDGAAAGTVNNGKTVVYGSTGELAVGDGKLTINSVAVTSTAAELNTLDGVASTLTASELNVLDGILASTSELNTLSGITSATDDLNLLSGLVATDSATAANFSLLVDFAQTGVTATEFGYLDGVTSSIQTQLNAKLETETTTSIAYNNTTDVLTYTDEEGNDTTVDLTYLRETVTTLSLAANTLTYTDEEGNDTDIDLSIYLDDTNLARLTSGSVDSNGLATFTRDDATTFTLDFSPIFDGYNLSVGADDSTLRSLGSGESIKFIGSQNVTTASDAEGNITITGPDLSGYLLSSNEFLTATNVAAKTSGSLTLNDSVELRLGTGADVKIDFDGTDYITNVTAGDTKLELGGDFTITNNAGSTTYFNIDADGETSLRHNGSEKLNTSANGVEVTGRIDQGQTRIISSSANTGTTSTIAFAGIAAEIVIAVEDIADSTKRQISKILVTTDDTDVFITEYGATWSDSELISGITGVESSGTITVTVTTSASSKHRLNATALA